MTKISKSEHSHFIHIFVHSWKVHLESHQTHSIQAVCSHHHISRYAWIDLTALDRKSTPEHTCCTWLYLRLLTWKREIEPGIVVLPATKTHQYCSVSFHFPQRSLCFPFLPSTVYCKQLSFRIIKKKKQKIKNKKHTFYGGMFTNKSKQQSPPLCAREMQRDSTIHGTTKMSILSWSKDRELQAEDLVLCTFNCLCSGVPTHSSLLRGKILRTWHCRLSVVAAEDKVSVVLTAHNTRRVECNVWSIQDCIGTMLM